MRRAETADQAAPIRTTRSALWRPLRILLLAALLAYAVRAFLVEPYAVPSASMRPTVRPGDHLLVEKFAYGYGPASLPFLGLGSGISLGRSLPERGEIVVFADPEGSDRFFIKRVAGLPGDRISGRYDGRIELNGRLLPREHDGDFEREEIAPGRSYRVLQRQDGHPLDEFPALTVPPGHLFVLGDNRDASEDSRVPPSRGGFGFVPVDHLVGRASVVILPAPAGENRFDRLGKLE
ncbi:MULTISPECIES: signal peptidase I [Pacificimonas]|nr:MULTISPECIES: signal peptidase I [Pacificimonas]MBZ6378490.1 signal peptidase I [Pacificimonas aurantium]